MTFAWQARQTVSVIRGSKPESYPLAALEEALNYSVDKDEACHQEKANEACAWAVFTSPRSTYAEFLAPDSESAGL